MSLHVLSLYSILMLPLTKRSCKAGCSFLSNLERRSLIISFMMNPEKKPKLAEKDKLSSLPKELIDAILIRMPLRDAVRTSILSSTWRYHWSSISQLVFAPASFLLPGNLSQPEFDKKVVNIIDHILLLHQGPIQKFQLSIGIESSLDIDRWMLFVSRNGIKELVLFNLRGEKYRIPSCLFSCEDLSYLKLYRCTIVPPASFKGFSNIKTLSLNGVSFSNSGLDNFISKCPLLNELVLNMIDGCPRLKLSAPHLVGLEVIGNYENICFIKTPLLAKVFIHLWRDGVYQWTESGAQCKFIHLIDSLSSVRRLELHGDTYKMLFATGDIPVRLATTCQLLQLSLTIRLEDKQEMLAALCIFRSSPFLQKIDIVSIHSSIDEVSNGIWEAQEDFNGLFSLLQILNVTQYTGTTAELKFIEFVLANAPVLEMVHVELDENFTANALEILRKLIRLERISSKAKIVVPEEASLYFEL